MNARRNVRARLDECVRITGTDDCGNPFEVRGKTVDFSRKGIGVIADRDLLVPGMAITLNVPDKLASRAVVQWSRGDGEGGTARVGLKLIDPKVSLMFRLAACFLLSFALLSQLTFSRPRGFSRTASPDRCAVGLADMKNTIRNVLGKYGYLTEDEKTFLSIQHERMTSVEYTKWLGEFFKDERKRNAAFAWYRYTFRIQETPGAGASGTGTISGEAR